MNINKMIEMASREFRQKLQDFCQSRDTSHLTPELAEDFSRTAKQTLASIGTNAFKSFLESFDRPKQTIKRQGKIFRYKMTSSKAFLTPFWEVIVNRRIYQGDKGGKCAIPLDESWDMEKDYVTMDVREALVCSSAQMTAEETAQLLKKCAFFQPLATTIKGIVGDTGMDFNDKREELGQTLLEKETLPDGTDAVAISMGGANVLLKEPGKKKGRPAQRPKQSEGSDASCYKNAMVGSFSFYRKEENDRLERLQSRYLSRMPQDRALDFKKEFEAEASHILKEIPQNKIKKIVLCDGARGIWKYIENTECFKSCEKLLDYYHCLEYVSKALFGKSSKAAKRWYQKWRRALREEDEAPRALMRSIKYYRAKTRLLKHQKETVKTVLTFFRNNKNRMGYASFMRRGLPIGSGPVEAACKSIVKQRLCRSGMRWTRKGGENVLLFRSLVKSNRWDTALNWYKDCKKAA